MSTTFVQTASPTPFGVFDSDAEFQAEADSAVIFVKRHLGDDIVAVELTSKQIWSCLEQSTLEFGSYINKYQTKSQLATLIGQTSGSLSGSEGRSHQLPREQLQFLRRLAEPYAMEAGLGGSYSGSMGYFELTASVQDYNIYTQLKNAETGKIAFSELTGSQRTKIRVVEVFHFSPQAAYRFFDSTSAINYLNNEFSFESFTPETIFYVLPVFEDTLRAQQMDVSQRVRRSNYSYVIQGSNIRIYPMPTNSPTPPTKLWVRYQVAPDPYNPDYDDQSIHGISNLSNMPLGNLKYSNINSIGRQWIRDYCLALSKELLGLIRSKVKSIPIPNGEVQLNGEDLVAQGREDQERLRTELIDLLESLTFAKLILQEADKTDALMRQLRAIPVPLGGAITAY